jgi:hypothetical protein
MDLRVKSGVYCRVGTLCRKIYKVIEGSVGPKSAHWMPRLSFELHRRCSFPLLLALLNF